MLELLKKDLYVLMTYGRHMVPAEKGIRQYEEYIEILSRCPGVIRCQPYGKTTKYGVELTVARRIYVCPYLFKDIKVVQMSIHC